MLSSLSRAAHAKINLSLHVTGKRADGYHLLESLISFATLHDIITVEPHDALALTLTGPFAPVLHADSSENLLCKTAKTLAYALGRTPDVHITLDKHIPIGAGIGGGSADAACLLHLLQILWKSTLAEEEIYALALSLGADVPICYHGKTMLVEGIGEVLTPLPFPHHIPAVLINPLRSLSTIAVFRHGVAQFSPAHLHHAPPEETNDFITWLHHKNNDLQAPATLLMPDIHEIITLLRQQTGCVLARMSGSGATCFGLFASQEQSMNATATLRHTHPHWWIQNTLIGNP